MLFYKDLQKILYKVEWNQKKKFYECLINYIIRHPKNSKYKVNYFLNLKFKFYILKYKFEVFNLFIKHKKYNYQSSLEVNSYHYPSDHE
jgi:hypothetical protein